MANRKQPAKRRKPARRDVPKKPGLITRAAKLLTGVVLLLAVGWVAVFFLFAPDIPDTSKLFRAASAPGVTILTRDGGVLARSGSLRGMVGVHDLPPYLPQAVIATEDRRFYQHFGMDVIGFARAMIANIRAGHIVQGGSTITQQLAKNLWLTPERTIERKLKELILAVWLEARLSKDEILTLYLNRVYLGAGSYGVEAASQRYFGKSARKVTLAEAALLTGLLKAPSRYAPTNNPKLAHDRALEVLDNMVEAGFLTRKEIAAAKSHRVRLASTDFAGTRNKGYFVDWIESQIPLFVGRVDQDIVVETTLDARHQKLAEQSVGAVLERNGDKRNFGQAALVAFTPDGAVRAMVGGRSYEASPFNRAIQAQRQPGSAFKPFLYLAALETGMWPEARIEDAPITIDGWSPQNFERTYEGTVTLERALSHSINTAAVRLAQRIGPDRIIATARRLGITSPLVTDLTIALGTSEVNLFELVSAYLPFANGGYGVFPYGIRRIRTTGGDVLYERTSSSRSRVVDIAYVDAMNRMLSRTLEDGTGKRARLDDRAAAGKTGTTQDYRDGWFVGYTADLVAGVWVGNDDNSPMRRVTGGQQPATIWRNFMSAATTDLVARALPGETGLDVKTVKSSIRGLLSEISEFFSGGSGRSGNAGKDKPLFSSDAKPSDFENRGGE